MKVIKIILVIIISLLVLAGFFFAYGLYINPKSPLGKAEFQTENQKISVRYYRPFKNNRLIFGEAADGALVPYGAYWRLGANLTTKISTDQKLNFAGRVLPKGTYGLYAYPYAENWVIYVHTKTGGFSFSEPNPEGVLMKVNVPVQTTEEAVEQFTIDFVESSLRMRWDTTKVVIPIN
ncbi:DUF2911 domain-containing protein [Flavobacteriaceae bacterium]|nr:DUF2911 domain-containing protein [Flavobacteriaceae bacterium]